MAQPRHRTAAPAPARPNPLLQQALAAFQQGDAGACATQCEKILAKRPKEPVALHLLGASRLRLGDADGAVKALMRAAKYDAKNGEVHANLGAALRAAGDRDGAIEALQRAVALNPAAAPARFNLGNALAETGRHDDAVAAYRDALTIDPGFAAAHNNMGLALAALDRADEAMESWRASLKAVPGQRDAHLNLARALLTADAADEAIPHFEAALGAFPDDPALVSEYGATLARAGRGNDAVTVLRRALDANPESRDLMINLGNALCMAGKPRDAVPLLEKAAALDESCAACCANLGHALKQAGDLVAATAAYDRALRRDANSAEALFGRATCRLLKGEFPTGWDDYKARDSMAQAGPAMHRMPLPADMTGKRILVMPDQGIGDELFFLRFVPALQARGADVSYLPDPRLHAMLDRSGLCPMLDADAPRGGFDYRIAVGDLPCVLQATDTPPSLRLDALPEREARLRERLTAFGPPPWIGVTWRAGTQNRQNLLSKESPATRLADLLRPLGARIVVLQRAPADGEVAAFSASLGRAVLDLSELNADLEDMLALAGLLTDQVCVSNTNVHLATARGRTCRILVPNPPEFRLMAAEGPSPWFPDMPTYREDPATGWDDALNRLKSDLERG
jgi:tetratricopeptide (TPR) repeat protein